jgi:hypothetical protein
MTNINYIYNQIIRKNYLNKAYFINSINSNTNYTSFINNLINKNKISYKHIATASDSSDTNSYVCADLKQLSLGSLKTIKFIKKYD